MRLAKYFTDPEEKIYIDLRRGKGHASKFERVNHDDSDLDNRILSKTFQNISFLE